MVQIDGRYYYVGFDHWRIVVSNNTAYVANALTSSVSYKGTTSTYALAAKVGDMYIASSQFTIPSGQSASGAAVTAETGDYIICRTSGTTTTSKWDVIQKNRNQKKIL